MHVLSDTIAPAVTLGFQNLCFQHEKKNAEVKALFAGSIGKQEPKSRHLITMAINFRCVTAIH